MAYLPAFFASLGEQTVQDYSVTVVDNASTDGAASWLLHEHPEVATLRNFRNQGLCRAHNQGIQLALTRWPEEVWPYRYVLIADPDIEFAPGALAALVSFMDANPKVMACGPKMLRAHAIIAEDGSRESEHFSTIDSTGIQFCRSRRAFHRGAGEEDRGQYDEEIEVFGISRSCLLVRASAILHLKFHDEFFDEDMFQCLEDVDLAWRMQRYGMPVCLVPAAIIWHHSHDGQTYRGLSALFHRHTPSPAHTFMARNQMWLLIKNDTVSDLLLHAPWVIAVQGSEFLIGIFRPSRWMAGIQAMGRLSVMLTKRREIKYKTSVSGRAMRRHFK